MKTRTIKPVLGILLVAFLSLGIFAFNAPKGNEEVSIAKIKTEPTYHKTIKVNGVDIFYREAGDVKKPTIVLLHGYPTSSHMFRNLITDLSVRYHVLAPDYPGYGRSEQPAMENFDYTFDNMSLIVEGFLQKLHVKKYSLYLMDMVHQLDLGLHQNIQKELNL